MGWQSWRGIIPSLILITVIFVSQIAAGADDNSSAPLAGNLSLDGTTFRDLDGNGFLSPGEPRLKGWTVLLMRNGSQVATAITDRQGHYRFADLSPGLYLISEDLISGWNLTAPGSGSYQVNITDKPGFDLDFGVVGPLDFKTGAQIGEHPIMHPTPDEATLWTKQYNAAPGAYLSPMISAKLAAAPGTSCNLLNNLQYTASERNQGSCGNCWAWAGTGVMEIDYARQMGVKDRFSIQYLDSNYNGGCGNSGACCGGWLENLASFYKAKGKAVPWSNSNAQYKDVSRSCGACSAQSASSISTSPSYSIASISAVTIPTQGVGKETAIANIKNVLQQGKGVWFGYFLPTGNAWSAFSSFWNTKAESDVWQPDSYCAGQYNYQTGGGHAVLCVGYDDTDPNNRYWVMLNSWGKSTLRPGGLFRVNMDMNYDCQYPSLGYAFYWMTLDMSYASSANNAPATPDVPEGSAGGLINSAYSFATSATDPDGDKVLYTFNWGDGSTSATSLVASGATGTATHSWTTAGTYSVTAKATDSKGASSGTSTGRQVTISSNRAPGKPLAPSGTSSGSMSSTYSYFASAIDPDGDTVQLIFDWGDGSTSQVGPVSSNTKVGASHSWTLPGVYYVKVMARDCKSADSSWSSSLVVKISDTANRAPNTPSTPSGSRSGYAGKPYSFTSYATDPDRESIRYTFDWGDASSSQSDFVGSGQSSRLTHTWTSPGSYLIKVQASDHSGAASSWSRALTVKILAAKGDHQRESAAGRARSR
ncbi:MAG: PKD domain-containing protein [Methanothrix sp.]|nr:MAG: PKD domain-containing protein [Methanothrix sp.]